MTETKTTVSLGSAGWRNPALYDTPPLHYLKGFVQRTPNLLDGDLCRRVIEFAEANLEWEIEEKRYGHLRNADTTQLPEGSDLAKEVNAKLWPMAQEYIGKRPEFAGLKLTTRPLEVLRYNPGWSCNRHVDRHKTGSKAGTMQLFAHVTELNDDHEGGELGFWADLDVRPPQMGSSVMFPGSSPLLMHQVNTVRKAPRYAIVTWHDVQGEPPPGCPEHEREAAERRSALLGVLRARNAIEFKFFRLLLETFSTRDDIVACIRELSPIHIGPDWLGKWVGSAPADWLGFESDKLDSVVLEAFLYGNTGDALVAAVQGDVKEATAEHVAERLERMQSAPVLAPLFTREEPGEPFVLAEQTQALRTLYRHCQSGEGRHWSHGDFHEVGGGHWIDILSDGALALIYDLIPARDYQGRLSVRAMQQALTKLDWNEITGISEPKLTCEILDAQNRGVRFRGEVDGRQLYNEELPPLAGE
jgi:predicted 2-oxoglutarate/Fe(II)-dependent dioxygenase YbiX